MLNDLVNYIENYLYQLELNKMKAKTNCPPGYGNTLSEQMAIEYTYRHGWTVQDVLDIQK